MITEKLWEICDSKEVVERFSEICLLFSGHIPEYDIMDIGDALFDSLYTLKTKKEFGKMIHLINLILEKQPALYEREFPYIVMELIDYYCYNRNSQQVERFFNDFIKDPENDFDMYLMSFQYIIFYGYTDIIRKAVSENIEPIEESEKYIPGAEDFLRLCGIALALEDYYQNNKEFYRKTFYELIYQYDYKPNEQYIHCFQQVFYGHIPEKKELISQLRKNIDNALVIFYMMFLKYMYDRGMPFYISSSIMMGIQDALGFKKKKSKSLKSFLTFDETEFESFLRNQTGGGVSEYYMEFYAILWGAFYFNDFLRSYELIDENVYSTNNNKLRILKCKAIISSLNSLWKYEFLHRWPKPDSVPEEEFNLEAVIFNKSYELSGIDWDALAEQIKEELGSAPKFSDELETVKNEIEAENAKEEQADLDDFILDFFDEDEEDDDFVTDEDDEEEDDDVFFDNIAERKLQPVRKEPKIGRNALCPCGSGKKYKKCCGK